MNREIKFKVIDEETKELVGYEFIKNGEWQHQANDKPVIICYGVFQGKKVKRKYIRFQFTGLQDKNGKDIYEGDIVSADHKAYMAGHCEGTRIVEFHFGYYGAVTIEYTKRKNRLDYFHQLSNLYEIEIIGKIYENPKLMEG